MGPDGVDPHANVGGRDWRCAWNANVKDFFALFPPNLSMTYLLLLILHGNEMIMGCVKVTTDVSFLQVNFFTNLSYAA